MQLCVQPESHLPLGYLHKWIRAAQWNAALLIFTWAFFLSLVYSRVYVRLNAGTNLSTITDLALLQPDGDNIGIHSEEATETQRGLQFLVLPDFRSVKVVAINHSCLFKKISHLLLVNVSVG